MYRVVSDSAELRLAIPLVSRYLTENYLSKPSGCTILYPTEMEANYVKSSCAGKLAPRAKPGIRR